MSASHSSSWVSDATPEAQGAAGWLDASVLSVTSPVSAQDMAQACSIIAASLAQGQSWSQALSSAAATGPRRLRTALDSCAASLARGVELRYAAASLPRLLAGWLTMAAASSTPPHVLGRAVIALESQRQWQQAPRRWVPALAAVAVVFMALSVLVGVVLVPAAAGPDASSLPALVRLTPVLAAAAVAVFAALAIAATLVLRRSAADGATSMPAHFLASEGLTSSWPARLSLTAHACQVDDLEHAAQLMARGTSLADALASYGFRQPAAAISAGTPAHVAFADIALAADASRERFTRALPAVFAWSALPVVVLLVIGTVLGIVIPLMSQGR